MLNGAYCCSVPQVLHFQYSMFFNTYPDFHEFATVVSNLYHTPFYAYKVYRYEGIGVIPIS